MAEADTFAVKIVLKDEMYPTFKFLKRRFFSIYPRFKTAIERDELFKLIPGVEKLKDQIEVAQSQLKEPLTLYVKGSHSEISAPHIRNYFIISSKGTEKFEITKEPIGQAEFKESIKNIDKIPSVIAHAEDIDADKTMSESIRKVTRELVLLLPPRDRNSCFLCSTSCKKYGTLDEVNINDSLSEEESLGKLIQTCLVEKVAKVLRLISDFIELFLPIEHPEEPHEQEPLTITVTKSLQKTIRESSLNQEKDELGDRKAVESHLAFYICTNLETQICQNVSIRHKVRKSVAHEFLCQTKFDEKLKEKIEEDLDIFKKSAAEIERYFGDFPERISDDLEDLNEQADGKLPVIAKVLRKMQFEINGVFRQAKVQGGEIQPTCIPTHIPEDLHTQILSAEGVFGCGFICGKLVVHAKGTADKKDLTDKVKMIMRRLNRLDFINNFEVQRINSSQTAGITYESGKSIRVKKIQDQVDAGDSSIDDFSYGTLGCFVKGTSNEAGSDSYTTQMYALSCAHVFPDGCANCVEVGRTDKTYDVFGIVSPELKLYRDLSVDIAAVFVDTSVEGKCNVRLKNCDGFEGWKSILHEGSFGDMIEKEVYKWGSASDLTTGLITSIDYQTPGTETLKDQYNILIENLPGSADPYFSTKGDSGTVVCFEDPEQENVVALSIINGALYKAENGEFICSYSCHLHTNIEALSEATNMRFEWYDG